LIPIIDFPSVVKEFAGFFGQVLSYHQLKRFKQYLTGLITGRKPTVRSMASRLVEPVDQSSLNRFLTLYEWDEEELNRRRLELLQSMEEMRWQKEGVIAIDDTLLPKTGRKMPGAGKLFDPNSKSHVHAQCLVTSHYVDLEKDYPVDFRQYFKSDSREAKALGFKSKVELAMGLIDECERLGVAAENYVFDAWFLSEELADHVEAYGKGWVSRLKANRIIYCQNQKMSIRDFEATLARKVFREVKLLDKSHWVYSQVLDVNKLGKVRVVICYDDKDLRGEPVYLATNRLYWEEVRVVLCYSLRFRIDVFYKDAKQNLGLGGCNLRSLKGTRRHWQLGFLGYSLLKARICQSRLYRRLDSDRTVGAECRQAVKDLLQSLIQWIYSMADKIPVEKILDVILR
jgi:hypothetical protein